MSLELWLIRHGQTTWNAEGRIQGQSNSQLSELGIQQAKSLAECLAGERFDFTYSSDVDRARHTAELALPKAELQFDERLREISFGLIEGKTHAELNEEEQAWFEHYKQDLYSQSVPQGETWKQHIERLAAWMQDLLSSGRVVAFSHGGSIRAVIFSVLGYPKTYSWNMSFENTGITRLRITETSKLIFSINDAAHLETLEFAQ